MKKNAKANNSTMKTCDDCESQEEGRHYCLLHGKAMKNMDIKGCSDFEERAE